MATDWLAEQLSIYNDFEEEGFQITVRGIDTAGVFNPATLAYDNAEQGAVYTTYGIKKECNLLEIKNTVVDQHNIKLLFPAYCLDADGNNTILPLITPANKIVIAGVEQNVVGVQVVAPSNVFFLFKALIRTL